VKNKTILITGGTSGVGKATVEKLASFGSHIILIVRNRAKAKSVIETITKNFVDARIDIIEGDLSSLKSIASSANEIKVKFPVIDVLINNAGGVFSKKEMTEDGFEWAYQVNYLSHFLLTNLIIENILKSDDPRIINISSEAHRIGSINFDNLNCERNFSTWRQYGATKLMNILFSKGLTNRFSSKGLYSFALHPGVVKTEFGANNTGFLGYFNKMPFLISAEKGAETSVYLATQDIKKLNNGGYYKKSMISYSSLDSQDIEVQQQLWDVSLKQLEEKGFIFNS
jgi:retinol dehydrogenase-12